MAGGIDAADARQGASERCATCWTAPRGPPLAAALAALTRARARARGASASAACVVALFVSASLGRFAYLLAHGPDQSGKPQAAALSRSLAGAARRTLSRLPGLDLPDARARRRRASVSAASKSTISPAARRRRARRAGRPGFSGAARPRREGAPARTRRAGRSSCASARTATSRSPRRVDAATPRSIATRRFAAPPERRLRRRSRRPGASADRGARRARISRSIMSRSPTAISRSRTRRSARRRSTRTSRSPTTRAATRRSVAVSARGPSGPLERLGQGAECRRDASARASRRTTSASTICCCSTPTAAVRIRHADLVQVRRDADARGRDEVLKGGFSLGAGYFKLDDPDHEPTLVDEATGRVGWDAAQARFRLDEHRGARGRQPFPVRRLARAARPTTRLARDICIATIACSAGERPGELPVAIDDAVVRRAVSARRGRASSSTASPCMARRSDRRTDRRAARRPRRAEAQDRTAVGPSGLADMLRIWPSFINPDARNWCLQHIHGGDLGSGSMKARLDAARLQAAHEKRAGAARQRARRFHLRERRGRRARRRAAR